MKIVHELTKQHYMTYGAPLVILFINDATRKHFMHWIGYLLLVSLPVTSKPVPFKKYICTIYVFVSEFLQVQIQIT